MKIKRRIAISNILMLVVPLAVCLAVFWCSMYVVWNVTGFKGRFPREGTEGYTEAIAEMRALTARWASESADNERIAEDAARFNRARRGSHTKMLVYRNGKPVVRQSLGDINPTLRAALAGGGSVSFLSRMSVDVVRAGDLRAALIDADFHERNGIGFRELTRAGLVISILCSLFVVFLMNRFLTQFVFRHIVAALDTFTSGVRRISGGDLNARIEYAENDEFAAVCRDFNDMASRLLDSVNERERDMASRRELIAGISHDLRTPLTSIKAYVEGLQQGVAASPEAEKRYVDTIGSKAADMERIIDNLFLFSKLDIGEFPYRMERAELAGVLESVADELGEEYAAKGLDISLEAAETGLCARIDTMQFRNVVVNILENSVKYKNRERAAMRITLARDESRAKISFADDGPGVPPDALPKLFGLFFRGDPSRSSARGGSGLGLAISAKAIERFGGAAAAENVPGGGLAIVLSLPLCGEEPGAGEPLKNNNN